MLKKWTKEAEDFYRRDEVGRAGAIAFAPGSPEDTWGWFAIAPDGRSAGGKTAVGEGPTFAMKRADDALTQFGVDFQ